MKKKGLSQAEIVGGYEPVDEGRRRELGLPVDATDAEIEAAMQEMSEHGFRGPGPTPWDGFAISASSGFPLRSRITGGPQPYTSSISGGW